MAASSGQVGFFTGFRLPRCGLSKERLSRFLTQVGVGPKRSEKMAQGGAAALVTGVVGGLTTTASLMASQHAVSPGEPYFGDYAGGLVLTVCILVTGVGLVSFPVGLVLSAIHGAGCSE